MSLSENIDLVRLMNDSQGWALPACCRERYVAFLNASGAEDVEKKTSLLQRYHEDYSTIRMLGDAADAHHSQAWDAVANLVRGVLGSRFAMLRPDFDDLVQITLEQIGRGLVSFRYESRPTTWMHKIAINVAREHIRAMSALRRQVQAESLDDHADIADPHDHISSAVSLREICEEIVRTLAKENDQRLLAIFQLRVLDDKKLEDISAVLKLSPGRISSLLKVARQLLRDNVSLREEAMQLGFDSKGF